MLPYSVPTIDLELLSLLLIILPADREEMSFIVPDLELYCIRYSCIDSQ